MGRAGSNTKRRPTGRRGWRKIDVDALLQPEEEPISAEEQARQVQELRDSQLWRTDAKPRNKHVSKAMRRQRARDKLSGMGHSLSSIPSQTTLTAQAATYKRQQRLNAFKATQPTKKRTRVRADSTPLPAHTIKLCHRNTRKALKLDGHADRLRAKKNAGKNRDVHRNNPYNRANVKHAKANTANAHIKDLWADETSLSGADWAKSQSRNPNLQFQIKDLWAESSSADSDLNFKSGKKAMSKKAISDLWTIDQKKGLRDVNPLTVIRAAERASYMKSTLGGVRAVHNGAVRSRSSMAVPSAGESLNPHRHEYYYLKWRSLNLQHNQMFAKHYQNAKTRTFWAELHTKHKVRGSNNVRLDARLASLKLKAAAMRKLYLQHLRVHRMRQRTLATAWKTSLKTEKSVTEKGRKSWKGRKGKRKRKVKAMFGGKDRIYGPKYRFRARATPTMAENKIGGLLRTTMHSGTDHPLRFVFSELQRKNRVPGNKRNRFTFPKTKAFHGPRFKCQTKIGKLYHENVDNPLFDGFDELEQM